MNRHDHLHTCCARFFVYSFDVAGHKINDRNYHLHQHLFSIAISVIIMCSGPWQCDSDKEKRATRLHWIACTEFYGIVIKSGTQIKTNNIVANNVILSLWTPLFAKHIHTGVEVVIATAHLLTASAMHICKLDSKHTKTQWMNKFTKQATRGAKKRQPHGRSENKNIKNATAHMKATRITRAEIVAQPTQITITFLLWGKFIIAATCLFQRDTVGDTPFFRLCAGLSVFFVLFLVFSFCFPLCVAFSFFFFFVFASFSLRLSFAFIRFYSLSFAPTSVAFVHPVSRPGGQFTECFCCQHDH